MNYKDFLRAMEAIESDRNIDKDIVIAALKEALEKAYKKHVEVSDALVDVTIDEESGNVAIFRKYLVVEEVEDDELEVDLETAHQRDGSLAIGDYMAVEESIQDLGRPAALLAKNVLKQKIREAEKQGVYDEYISQLGDLVTVSIETVEEKFLVVNLGKTLALMPKAAQIPGERYYEGQKIKVVISEVNRDTKGAQILVSRSDEQLVRRLFEREIPEIYQGLVEIKAIARDAGERTKIAVYSKHDDIDALGACIGPGGSRVHEIIDEIRGEKIDVFEWSDNIVELVSNALAPAKVISVIPAENKRSILVVVEDDQLSLAIGKKGKNARLAVKLTGKKIDIKTPSTLAEAGIDYKKLEEEYQNKLAEEAVLKQLLEPQKPVVIEPEHDIEVEPVTEIIDETSEATDVAQETTPVVEPKPIVEADTPTEVVAAEKPVVKKAKPVVKRTEYVSKFEKLADVSKTTEAEASSYAKRKYRKEKEEEERRLRDAEIRKEKEYEIKPEYSEEELEEIRLQQEEERRKSWIEDEIDFDEFDEFYE